MFKLDSSYSSFALAIAIAGATAYVVIDPAHHVRAQQSTASTAAPAAGNTAAKDTAAKPQWLASAPGRIEPRDGEIRLASLLPGKISHVIAAVNDKVRAGDLLFQLEDEDAEARVTGAEAEVAVRTRERDNENVGKLAKDRRTAEDSVAKSERALFQSRLELDRQAAGVRAGTGTAAAVDKAFDAVKSAHIALDRDRAILRRVSANRDMPLPTRLEAGLSVARAELSIAETAYNRTRVRSPADAVILAVNAKVGELATPSSELPMVILGDTSRMRVRAEFDERDIDKVRVGQAAIVTTDGFPGRQFEARVTQVAKSLGQPRVSQKGPRRPNDVDVLEVFVEVDGVTPLISGMRADVFLKVDAATAETKSN
jgi:HlyD family secretion protein